MHIPEIDKTRSIMFSVGIVGATGAVGMEVVKCLFEKSFPVAQLRLFASSKSAGKTLHTGYGDIVIEEFTIDETRKCHFVFLAVSGDFALQYAPLLTVNDGPFVIDNSSAFRYISDIPLVVSVLQYSITLWLFATPLIRFQR